MILQVGLPLFGQNNQGQNDNSFYTQESTDQANPDFVEHSINTLFVTYMGNNLSSGERNQFRRTYVDKVNNIERAILSEPKVNDAVEGAAGLRIRLSAIRSRAAWHNGEMNS